MKRGLSVIDTYDIVDISDIDFSELMDLRVDYAFKLLFGTGDTKHLISLLNAIFENKGIPRVVDELVVVNPSLERATLEDKLSILDLRATFNDGTTVCIEMHLYDRVALKYKTMRSWARVYGENIGRGQDYVEQNAAICISFSNGPVADAVGKPIEKIHALVHAMERDSHEVIISGMEIHFIDMAAFVKHCNAMEKSETYDDMFTKWLMVITEKEIKDKDRIRNVCEEGAINEAMKTLTRFSSDKIKRLEYQRRQDELYFYNTEMAKKDAAIAALADKDAALADKDAALADKDAALADKDAALADKDAALADKDTEIAALKAELKKATAKQDI